MAGIAHLGVGLAAKPLAPKAPLWMLLLGAETIDLLWGVFFAAKLEDFGLAPWSHGLLMAVVWSLAGGAAAAGLFRDQRAGVVVGLVVFSHWVVDFISHPMFGGPPDLPLLLAGSPQVGLGLYSALPDWAKTVVEFGSVIAGLAVYWRWRMKHRRAG